MQKRTLVRRLGALALAGSVAAISLTSAPASAGSHRVFLANAIEHGDDTVTLPLHEGYSIDKDGNPTTVYYIVTEASNSRGANQYGVAKAQKLANAAGTGAVQSVTVDGNGRIHFPATVDFTPDRDVQPGPNIFPPSVTKAGAVGNTGYSPLIQLPDGTILNAPHLGGPGAFDNKHWANKVVSVDLAGMTVRHREAEGFAGGKRVYYISTDSSAEFAAALEDVTFAPALANAPGVGDDSTKSSRATLALFVNGQAGAANPQRQGIVSAMLGEGDPLNVLAWTPNQGRYSPLWDVHATAWSDAAVANGTNSRQTSIGKIKGLVKHGAIAGFTATGMVVNCPIISSD